MLLSSFEEYLASEAVSSQERVEEEPERQGRLQRFPHAVLLQVSYPELDFANRWCWQRFGPADGECLERYSEYRACDRSDAHSHDGKWMWHWLAKTDYDFGFCEWCFSEQADREAFLASLPDINWGEKYPK